MAAMFFPHLPNDCGVYNWGITGRPAALAPVMRFESENPKRETKQLLTARDDKKRAEDD
jgi:hypothetical protein